MKAHDNCWDAVVCGAGMSGSACALTLAGRGVRTLVINSDLDTLGLPAFGPLMALGPEGISALDRLPEGLRQVLLETSFVRDPDEHEDPGSGCQARVKPHQCPRGAWAARAAQAPNSLLVPPGPGVTDGADSSANPDLSQWGGVPFLVVDRRALSIRLKLLLEETKDIELRQAVAVGVEDAGPDATGEGLIVRTAFDDRFLARACVVAVGLGLRGRVQVGAQLLEGGRYGELPADTLWKELQGLVPDEEERRLVYEGGLWERRVLPVGASVAGLRADSLDDVATRIIVGTWLAKCWGLDADADEVTWLRLRPAAESTCGSAAPPPGLVPSEFTRAHTGADEVPAFLEGPFEALGRGNMWAAVGTRLVTRVSGPIKDCEDAGRHGSGGQGRRDVCGLDHRGGETVPSGAGSGVPSGTRCGWFVSDGTATGEWYVSPGADLSAPETPGFMVSRPEHTVCGMVLAERGGTIGGLWIVGRASGASTYLESLLSGASAGRRLADSLGFG